MSLHQDPLHRSIPGVKKKATTPGWDDGPVASMRSSTSSAGRQRHGDVDTMDEDHNRAKAHSKLHWFTAPALSV